MKLALLGAALLVTLTSPIWLHTPLTCRACRARWRRKAGR